MSFPRAAWAVLAGFAVVLLVCFGSMLALIRQQRDLTREQRRIASVQLRLFRPLVETARPLTAQALDGLPQLRAGARRADRLTRSTQPLVDDLVRAGLPGAVRSLADLADATTGSGLPRSLAVVLRQVRATRLVPEAARAAGVATRLDRKGADALTVLRATLRIQRQSLTINRQNLATARQTLATARRTEAHAASVDEKLAGPLLGTGR